MTNETIAQDAVMTEKLVIPRVELAIKSVNASSGEKRSVLYRILIKVSYRRLLVDRSSKNNSNTVLKNLMRLVVFCRRRR